MTIEIQRALIIGGSSGVGPKPGGTFIICRIGLAPAASVGHSHILLGGSHFG